LPGESGGNIDQNSSDGFYEDEERSIFENKNFFKQEGLSINNNSNFSPVPKKFKSHVVGVPEIVKALESSTGCHVTGGHVGTSSSNKHSKTLSREFVEKDNNQSNFTN
jgi:hypothetical protein